MMPSAVRLVLAFALVGTLAARPGAAPADEVDGTVLERERD